LIGDIRNNIKIIKYPRVENFENLAIDDILKHIKDHQERVYKFEENQNYYIGKNVAINTKKEVDINNPDSRVCVSYARTMTQIVKGYMYRPNFIQYDCENELYLEKLEQIFELNNEPLKTSELGESQSKYGIGIELLYIDRLNENPLKEIETVPYFCSVEPKEIILFYSMNMYEKLIGAIRFYLIQENKEQQTKLYKVEVYYTNRVLVYDMIEDAANQRTLTAVEDFPNYFNTIPFCVYKNNNECNADYEPVKTLIDAYDIMMSDSINEMQRFANAYLILKGFMALDQKDGNEETKVLETLKTKRILQFIGEEGGAEFLTRSIPSDFFNVVKMTLREDIQYNSHIPDFRAKNFEAASGVSMMYSLFDFENLCSDKQALFEVGLRQRLELINSFFKLKAMDIAKVNIKFNRNIPSNIQIIVDSFQKLASTNKLSDYDLLSILPKEILPDLESALARITKQKADEMAQFNLDTAQVQEQNNINNNTNQNNNQEDIE
jgi:SPP1 family phage portal protein